MAAKAKSTVDLLIMLLVLSCIKVAKVLFFVIDQKSSQQGHLRIGINI
jgi:hypothetical protein